MKKMINRFFSGLKRALGLQETISVVYVAIMLLPNLFLAVTEPYSWSTVLGSILLPATFYLLVSVSLPRPGGVMLCTLPLMILGAFQIVLLYLFGGRSSRWICSRTCLRPMRPRPASCWRTSGRPVVFVCVIYIPLLVLGVRSLVIKRRLGGVFRPSRAVGGGGVFRARRDFRARFDVRPSGIRHEIPCFSDQRDL